MIVVHIVFIIWFVGTVLFFFGNLFDWLTGRGIEDDEATASLRRAPLAPVWPLVMWAAIKSDLRKDKRA